MRNHHRGLIEHNAAIAAALDAFPDVPEAVQAHYEDVVSAVSATLRLGAPAGLVQTAPARGRHTLRSHDIAEMYLRGLVSAPLRWTGVDDARVFLNLNVPQADIAEETRRDVARSRAPPLDEHRSGPRLLGGTLPDGSVAALAAERPAVRGAARVWSFVRYVFVRWLFAFLRSPRSLIAEKVYYARVLIVSRKRKRQREDADRAHPAPVCPVASPGVRPCMVSVRQTLDDYLGGGLSRASTGRGGTTRPVGLPQ
jgi:hypothetical protein